MEIELLGWASSRQVARQFMETCEIAEWDAEAGEMRAREGVQLHPFRTSEAIVKLDEEGNPLPGFFFNLRVYGQLEENLHDPNYDPENPEDVGHLWSRLKLKNYVNNKLGVVAAKKGKEGTGARLPGGYEWSIGQNKVRLYDAAQVTNRLNVWA